MRRKRRVILLLILSILSLLLFSNNYFLSAVDSNDTRNVSFVIEENQNSDIILDNLANQDLIASKTVAQVYIRLSNQSNFQIGTFQLSRSMTLPEIIRTLNSSDNAQTINITFPEGIRVVDFANIANERLGIDVEEFKSLTNDQSFINDLSLRYEIIEKYEFNDAQLFKLEGLLAPDTYNLNYDTSARALIEILVAQTNTVYLEHQEMFENSDLNINEIFTLASIVEAEVHTYEDRMLVASIFMNRIRHNIPLGSDVTTYYGLQVQMGERDLTVSELAEVNDYNTRALSFIGLPVGPINSPSLQSILAALNYYPTEYLYFVNDVNGKTYPAITYQEHNEIITYLQEQGLWFIHD